MLIFSQIVNIMSRYMLWSLLDLISLYKEILRYESQNWFLIFLKNYYSDFVHSFTGFSERCFAPNLKVPKAKLTIFRRHLQVQTICFNEYFTSRRSGFNRTTTDLTGCQGSFLLRQGKMHNCLWSIYGLPGKQRWLLGDFALKD